MFYSGRHVAFNLTLSGILAGNRALITCWHVSHLLSLFLTHSRPRAKKDNLKKRDLQK